MPEPSPDSSTAFAIFCQHCGYDVRGTTSDNCPECGKPLNRDALTKSQLPWPHRREIGVAKAFIKTCWIASFRRNRLAAELLHPVEAKDAKSFRRLVVMFAFFGVAFLIYPNLGVIEDIDLLGDWSSLEVEDLEAYYPWMAGVLTILTWVFLMVLTGLHTFWYDPRGLPQDYRDRSLALSHYLCAPLVALPFFAGCYVIGVLLATVEGGDNFGIDMQAVGMTCVTVGLLGFFITLLIFWINSFRFAGRLAHRGPVGQVSLAIAQPIGTLLAGVMLFVALPMLVLYITAMIYSVTF